MDNSNNSESYYGFQGSRAMAMTSLIMGIISIPCGYLTGFIGVMLGLAAILLGAFSKGRAPIRSGISIGGITAGAVGFAIGIIMIVLVAVLMTNPEFMEHYKELLEFYNK